jgi:hypothetical protein
MLQILAAILAAFGLYLLLRSLWIRTGLSLRQVVVTLLAAATVLTLIVLAATGRLNWLVPAAAALLPVANRLAVFLKLGAFLNQQFPGWHRRFGRRRPAAAPPDDDASTTETSWLRMTLFHATGRMDGEVRQGRHRGRFLSELSLAELTALLAELPDFDSQRLLTGYLDRVHPGWEAAGARGVDTGAELSRAEALEILGLADGATEADIVAAHRRLIQRLHPDRGGSTYLAARINAARKVLLS